MRDGAPIVDRGQYAIHQLARAALRQHRHAGRQGSSRDMTATVRRHRALAIGLAFTGLATAVIGMERVWSYLNSTAYPSSAPLWPFPALYLVEVASLAAIVLLAVVVGRRSAMLVAWLALGSLSAVAVLGAMSIGFDIALALMFLIPASIVGGGGQLKVSHKVAAFAVGILLQGGVMFSIIQYRRRAAVDPSDRSAAVGDARRPWRFSDDRKRAAFSRAIVLAVFVASAPIAEGQEPAASFEQLRLLVRAGDRVTVTDAAGRETEGKIAALSPSRLELTVNGRRRDFAEYRFVGLSPSGNDDIEAMTDASYAEKMKRWERWITECVCSRGRLARQ